MAQHAGQAFFQSVSHRARWRNGAHQMVKLAFNRQPDRQRCLRDRILGCSARPYEGGSAQTLRLSKAVSYSSASITNTGSSPIGPGQSRGAWAHPDGQRRQVQPGTPPTRKPGCRPAHSSTHASMDVVVVLPCVPATASTWRPRSTYSANRRGRWCTRHRCPEWLRSAGIWASRRAGVCG